MGTLTLVIAVLLVFSVAFGLLFRSLLSAGSSQPADRSWLDEFSIAKYRPMLRLLSERDYEFLAMQSGFTPDIARRLRAERRKIFRAYLRSLVRDFNRISAAARELVAHAPEDHSELAGQLLRYQATFAMAVAAVEVRLLLHTIGIGTVDVQGLIGSLESFRNQVTASAVLPDFA